MSFGDGDVEEDKCRGKDEFKESPRLRRWDEESPRNTSHLKGLGVTNMEELGQRSASPDSAIIEFLHPHPILSKCTFLSACQTYVKQSRNPV